MSYDDAMSVLHIAILCVPSLVFMLAAWIVLERCKPPRDF